MRVQFRQRPDTLPGHEATNFQSIVAAVHIGHVVDAVERVERKRSRELRFRIGRRKPVGIKKERLRAVVQARDGGQKSVDRFFVGNRTARQQRQAAQCQQALAKETPGRHVQFAARVRENRCAVEFDGFSVAGFHDVSSGHDQRPRRSSERGTSMTIATCTTSAAKALSQCVMGNQSG